MTEWIDYRQHFITESQPLNPNLKILRILYMKNKDKAKEYLTLALSTNPYFDFNAVEEIRLVLGEQGKSG